MRGAFDNNFIDKFHNAPAAVQLAIVRCIESGQMVMYTSELVLKELMGLAVNGGGPKLAGLSATVLRLIDGHILASPQGLLESELSGATKLEMEPEASKHLVGYLGLAAQGKLPSSAAEVGRKALEEKQRALRELQIYVPYLDDRPTGMSNPDWKVERKKRSQRLKGISFNEVFQVWARKHAEKLLVMNYRAWDLREPEQTAKRVLSTLKDYPHHAHWIASHALPAYRFRALGEAPRDGDLFDHRQLLYGVEMDVFLTDDKRLKSWFGELYGGRLRVMTAAEFFGEKWC